MYVIASRYHCLLHKAIPEHYSLQKRSLSQKMRPQWLKILSKITHRFWVKKFGRDKRKNVGGMLVYAILFSH
jgi:hypothetical protein